MLAEHAHRSPSFRPGLKVRLADGQSWSLPLPDGSDDDADGRSSGWADPRYRAIVRAIAEAEDPGELFRAELALAIHLLLWNYALDCDDLLRLLDDRDAGGSRAQVLEALHALASAHLEDPARRALIDPQGDADSQVPGPVGPILQAAWQAAIRGCARPS